MQTMRSSVKFNFGLLLQFRVFAMNMLFEARLSTPHRQDRVAQPRQEYSSEAWSQCAAH